MHSSFSHSNSDISAEGNVDLHIHDPTMKRKPGFKPVSFIGNSMDCHNNDNIVNDSLTSDNYDVGVTSVE